MGLSAAPAEALSDPRPAMRDCVRCPALVRSRSQVVPGDGAIPADVMFVGLAPGRFGGDRTGIPFSGDRSGALLRAMIRRACLRRVFITNLVRCNPRDAGGRNRDPERSEVANCRGHLLDEIAMVRPRLIACLGRIAWRELAGCDALFAPIRAKPLVRPEGLLYPMYHPAYVNRGACSIRRYAAHFARLAKIINQIDSPRASGGV